MSLKIYNVLTRKKEEFVPLTEGRVNMYVCGPTVYDYSHIGHAKTYVGFDVVVRYLRYSGYDVLYVQNITDVGHMLDTGEDRILKKARQLSAGPMQVVETYMRDYFADMDALGVERPNISPRASAHIPEQISMVESLIESGHAYEVNGSVYFDVASFPEYGKLSGRIIEDQEEGVRETARSEKRHPADFALWKRAEPEHILRWKSPWGDGFPGWHIECSAMAHKYLGQTFDIHGGGIDNIFPHNECEIAQSEAAHGETFARIWMLTGSLTLDSIKMSKSLGNTLTIKDALKQWRSEAIRAFILSSHYSNPIDFSQEAVEAALKAAFIEKMNDDFNAPAALAVLQDLTRQANTWLNEGDALSLGSLAAIDTLYRDLGGTVLGIIPESISESSSDADREAGLIRLLIELRAAARQQKDWATSDKIRDQLKELHVVLEDRVDGTTWKIE